MTDSELVEAVARKVLGWELIPYDKLPPSHGKEVWRITEGGAAERFDPFNNANDLMMVLEKFDNYQITKLDKGYNACVSGEKYWSDIDADTLPHAVLEAALKAEEVER